MQKILGLTVFLTGLAVCLVFCGCEGAPDTENVNTRFDDTVVDSVADLPTMEAVRMQISQQPQESDISDDGDVVLFRVNGASGWVKWSVKDTTRGIILTQNRTSATYRRVAAGDNVLIATDSRGNSAFAVVKQP